MSNQVITDDKQLTYYVTKKVQSKRGSELSSYEIELWNRVTQNDVQLLVTNSKIIIKILLSSTNSTS